MKRFNPLAVASLVFAITLTSGGVAGAASYQQCFVNCEGPNNDPVIDPIVDVYGNIHPYSGPDLIPNPPDGRFAGSDLSWANLQYANLRTTYLYGVDLTGADLSHSYLNGTDFRGGAKLIGANLTGAMMNSYLDGTDLSNADLSGAYLGFSIDWESAIWTGAKYSLNAVDNNGNWIPDTIFPTGMDQAWRDAAGMVAVSVVPEPNTAVLIGIGLAGMSLTSRRTPKNH